MSPEEYKAIREKLALTQGGLAALLGVSLRTIANRESGVHPISREAALAIASLAKNPPPVRATG